MQFGLKLHVVWLKVHVVWLKATHVFQETVQKLLSLATINTHFSRATAHISSNKVLSLIKPSSNSAYALLSSNIISAFLLCDKKHTHFSQATIH